VLLRVVRNKFIGDTLTTIGIDFFTMTVELERLIARATIWDTGTVNFLFKLHWLLTFLEAGQERFRVVSNASYRGAHGVVVVYDITNHESFQNVSRWIADVREVAPQASLILLGNKSDLIHLRAVTTAEARAFAEANGLAFMETSARDASNVKEAFRALLEGTSCSLLTGSCTHCGTDITEDFFKGRPDFADNGATTKGGKTVPIRPNTDTEEMNKQSTCCL
jgi:hypothetical protein